MAGQGRSRHSRRVVGRQQGPQRDGLDGWPRREQPRVRQVGLEEAARLDGASTPRVLRSLILPVAAASPAATGVVLFVLDWNMLLVLSLLPPALVVAVAHRALGRFSPPPAGPGE